ncbi:transposable element Tc3 transposase [Trichonephila clavipes]|nr:transposable element Tc3 transposase [Trichonephila clavipes]
MTGHIYRDVVLEQHVRLFRGAMGAEFLFMDDNAHPHRANIVDECLQSEDITRMDWPAYSPDLNPIEHVWDMLGQRIVARQFPPTCLSELLRALLIDWCNIPLDQIDNLILSMPRCFVSMADECTLHELQNCLESLQSAQGRDLVLASTSQELQAVCETLKESLWCVDVHMKHCFTSTQRKVFNHVVQGAKQFLCDLCVPGPIQERSLHKSSVIVHAFTEMSNHRK